MQLLKAEGIFKKYPKSKRFAISDLSLEINSGEIVAVLGKNGAGKTTFISCLNGLLIPDKGTITAFGNILNNKNLNHFKKNIGAVMEGSRNVYWNLTALENLKYFGRLLFMNDDTIKKRSIELLSLFELDNVANKKVYTYSRGMQQKLAIAVALLNDPMLLFLDEPTLGLDFLSKNTIVSKLKELVQTSKCGILLTTHQLDIVETLATKILLIEEGKALRIANKNEFLSSVPSELISFKSKSYPSNFLNFLEQNFDDVKMENDTYTFTGNSQVFLNYILQNNLELVYFTKGLNLETIITEMYKCYPS